MSATDALSVTDDLFFSQGDLDAEAACRFTDSAIGSADDGELFLEYRQSESLSWDDGHLRSGGYDTSQGFGLRAVEGDHWGYAHGTLIDKPALNRAKDAIGTLAQGGSGGDHTIAVPNRRLYTDENPIGGIPFADKVELLRRIDAYARAKDPRIKQVSASIATSWQAVQIIRPGGFRVADIRPLVRLNVSVVAGQGDRRESGGSGSGGRMLLDSFIDEAHWRAETDEALRQALVNLEAVAAPAGEMSVVLGAGWPGVMLHEAVGHGLEGDFNRKKTSAFAGLLGEQVAAKGVTVIDDGTIDHRRGSLTIDDEGTPTQRTTLIEDGVLVGYMHDRMNARLMGHTPTGNGRRQSYAHHPMPRMTNTYMLGGAHTHDEVIQSVKNGIYAVNFNGGQVDITNGKFVFVASEAYLIENGKVTAPIKGATLIGNGADALTRVGMVADNMKLDNGIGTCGKDGQGVPVGVGQPTLRIDGLTVGGTQG